MSLLDTVNAGTNAIRHVALCVGVFSTMSYMLYNGVALLNLQSWADSVFTSSAGVTPLSSMNAANVMVLLLVEQQQVPLSVTDASLGTGESTEVVESTTRILLAQHALFTMDGFLNGFRQMETIFKCCSQPQHIPYQYTSAPLNPVAFPAEELLPRPLTSLQQQVSSVMMCRRMVVAFLIICLVCISYHMLCCIVCIPSYYYDSSSILQARIWPPLLPYSVYLPVLTWATLLLIYRH